MTEAVASGRARIATATGSRASCRCALEDMAEMSGSLPK
jgi:hypothetical protein